MENGGGYVPPAYIPLEQSDREASAVPREEEVSVRRPTVEGLTQWSSGICACCDDMPSFCYLSSGLTIYLVWRCIWIVGASPMVLLCPPRGRIGLICPCYLFGKNSEFLGSGTLMGSRTIHFLLWALVNAGCCLLTDGILLGLPRSFVSCHACSYRKALRSKHGLECAVCQEYREIHERSADSSHDLSPTAAIAPPTQTMESPPKE